MTVPTERWYHRSIRAGERLFDRLRLDLRIEGARSMGVGDRVGSLKAGKRADIIMVDTRAPNIGIFGDPAHMIVTAAQTSNVDTVVIDDAAFGHVELLEAVMLMRGGCSAGQEANDEAAFARGPAREPGLGAARTSI